MKLFEIACRALLWLAVPALVLADRGDAVAMTVLAASLGLAVRWSGACSGLQVLFLAPLTVATWAVGFGAVEDSEAFSAAAHIVLPAAVTPLLFLGVARTGAIASRPSGTLQRAGLFCVAIGLTSALGIGWEVLEWTSDSLLDTNMSPGKEDLQRDLAGDLLGASIGAALTVFHVLNVLSRPGHRAEQPT